MKFNLIPFRYILKVNFMGFTSQYLTLLLLYLPCSTMQSSLGAVAPTFIKLICDNWRNAGHTTAHHADDMGPLPACYEAYEADVESNELGDGGESQDGVEGARHVATAEGDAVERHDYYHPTNVTQSSSKSCLIWVALAVKVMFGDSNWPIKEEDEGETDQFRSASQLLETLHHHLLRGIVRLDGFWGVDTFKISHPLSRHDKADLWFI